MVTHLQQEFWVQPVEDKIQEESLNKKKMYGRMGGKMDVQRGLAVFKIDVDKNLLFLRGSVPGKAGTIVKIRDTLLFDKA